MRIFPIEGSTAEVEHLVYAPGVGDVKDLTSLFPSFESLFPLSALPILYVAPLLQLLVIPVGTSTVTFEGWMDEIVFVATFVKV